MDSWETAMCLLTSRGAMCSSTGSKPSPPQISSIIRPCKADTWYIASRASSCVLPGHFVTQHCSCWRAIRMATATMIFYDAWTLWLKLCSLMMANETFFHHGKKHNSGRLHTQPGAARRDAVPCHSITFRSYFVLGLSMLSESRRLAAKCIALHLRGCMKSIVIHRNGGISEWSVSCHQCRMNILVDDLMEDHVRLFMLLLTLRSDPCCVVWRPGIDRIWSLFLYDFSLFLIFTSINDPWPTTAKETLI